MRIRPLRIHIYGSTFLWLERRWAGFESPLRALYFCEVLCALSIHLPESKQLMNATNFPITARTYNTCFAFRFRLHVYYVGRTNAHMLLAVQVMSVIVPVYGLPSACHTP